jgi:hypothetical protein
MRERVAVSVVCDEGMVCKGMEQNADAGTLAACALNCTMSFSALMSQALRLLLDRKPKISVNMQTNMRCH